jgi:hypothetical protein
LRNRTSRNIRFEYQYGFRINDQIIKAICFVCALILLLSRTARADSISVEAFSKISDVSEREELIEQAPPQERDELKKVDLHLKLLTRWHGEEGLQIAKQTAAVRKRGLGDLTALFNVKSQAWGYYMAEILNAEKDSTTPENQSVAQAKAKISSEYDAIVKRLPNIQALIFSLAASPEALALDQKAAKAIGEWYKSVIWENGSPSQPITREGLMKFDAEIDEILAEMEKFSKLTPEQVREQVNSFPDEQDEWHGSVQPLYLPPVPQDPFAIPTVEY